jgi:PAS domain S-box-containing protein
MVTTNTNKKQLITEVEALRRRINELEKRDSEHNEAQLQLAEERFRTIFENSAVAITVTDENENIVSWNKFAEALLGMGQEDLYMKPVSSLYPDTDWRRIRSQNVRQKGMQHHLETKIIRKDQEIIDVDLSVSVLKGPDGKVTGSIGIMADITERKQMEAEREALIRQLQIVNQKLSQSNKELQDFAYVASHDLREPLRKITSFGALLQDSLKGRLDEDQQENLGFMIDGASRMQAMIDDLLSYSRVTTRAKPFEPVNLNEVIANLKDLELATLLDQTNGAVHVQKPLPVVYGDPSQMHQLFQNLVGNGLKFHEEGVPPEITIRAYYADDNMVNVEVQDNGIGIDEQYHEQIFTMFKCLNARAHYDGTGIGLAICQKIAHRHGGDIGVESTIGEGSTFWVKLPEVSQLTY